LWCHVPARRAAGVLDEQPRLGAHGKPWIDVDADAVADVIRRGALWGHRPIELWDDSRGPARGITSRDLERPRRRPYRLEGRNRARLLTLRREDAGGERIDGVHVFDFRERVECVAADRAKGETPHRRHPPAQRGGRRVLRRAREVGALEQGERTGE